MTDPRLTPLAAGLPATIPFIGPEAQERARGRPFRARIGANESVFGPSPEAVDAMRQAAAEAWMYGDADSFELRHALAAHHGVAAENVLVGEGIDAILGYLVRLTVAPGQTVATSLGAYPTLNFHVVAYGGILRTVPYRDDSEDLAALCAAAAEHRARLIYVANPDNPMGSWHDADAVRRAVDAVPDACVLALDEAYIDFAPGGTAPPIEVEDRRVIRLRTFSKAYGLAGLRVGYAIGDAALIAAFDRVRNHFAVGRVAQAGALAALRDAAHLQHVLHETAAARARIARIAQSCDLTPLTSATNFVTVDCGADPAFARSVLEELGRLDVFVRMPFAAPGNRCIRIGCGTAADLELLAEALPKALAASRTRPC